MTRKWFLSAILTLLFAGMVLAQSNPVIPDFTLLRQIGQLPPLGIKYNAPLDQFAWVELSGQLVLVSARTYQIQHTLYEKGNYNAYEFSPDGRYIALAIDQRVELWDTQSGQRIAQLEPSGALLVQGPLHFTPDGRYLLLDTVVPAPQATRRSENDTNIIPWIWDLAAERGEVSTNYVSGETAFAFFNFRNGLVVGPNAILVAGLPQRLQIIDGKARNFPVIGEIRSSRLERDPIYLWRSASDELLYVNVNPSANNKITQIDTRSGSLYDIILGLDLSYANLSTLSGLQIANNGRILCNSGLQQDTSLLRLILGPEYFSYQNYEPLIVSLIDVLVPMTMEQEQGALLVYIFNQKRGRGILELIRPQNIQKMILSPDHQHLMVRRTDNLQPIEIYNLNSCAIEQVIFPKGNNTLVSAYANPNASAPPIESLLAYNANGDEIISDFQRFSATSGELLWEDGRYVNNFTEILFSNDSRGLITLREAEWLLWDIETGRLQERAQIAYQGQLLSRSSDATRYLTYRQVQEGTLIEISDIRAQTQRQLLIPNTIDGSISALIPNDDWTQLIAVYESASAVYDFDRGLVLRISDDDLPVLGNHTYGWLDERTVYIAISNPSERPQPIYGIEYHPSGIPSCLVNALPQDWPNWAPIWEGLILRWSAKQLDQLALRLCAALPTQAQDVIPALTPTATYTYYSDATPIPYNILNIPDVPACLTARFPQEALDYATIWRQMSADLEGDELLMLEEMLCEGLIGSVSSIGPTPTINPNLNVPPTPTPISSAPITTNRNDRPNLAVITIDLETGRRSYGDHLPQQKLSTRDLSVVIQRFERAFGYRPNNPILSPDGRLLAVQDANGFVQILRLARPYEDWRQEQLDALATQSANEPPSIGFIPTATAPFTELGDVRPTITPTITTTPPSLPRATPQGSQLGQVTTICPARELYTHNNPAPDFDASGRLLIEPLDTPYITWVLEPETGKLYADDTIPTCDTNCAYSFDYQWLAQIGENGFVVSRADGSDTTILYPPEARNYFPRSFTWQIDNTLEYIIEGYLPQQSSRRLLLQVFFNPMSGQRSEPTTLPLGFQLYELPTQLISQQPNGPLRLLSTPYGQIGSKYYLYDPTTEAVDYFARIDRGSLDNFWHPNGLYLYYYHPQEKLWYRYDATSREHHLYSENLPGGVWSRDARYRADWITISESAQDEIIANGDLPPKLAIWDSYTGASRSYCLPQTGRDSYEGTQLFWSPDNRYVAFTIFLPPGGDAFPQPTATPQPYTPAPTPSPVPIADQYTYSQPYTIILNVESGSATIISNTARAIVLWIEDGEQK